MQIRKFTEKSLISGVFIFNQVLQDSLKRKIRTKGISYTGALIVVGLYMEKKEQPVGPGKLSSALKFSRSRISQEISKLEKAHFLQRQISELDSRKYSLKLSASGERLALEIVKAFESIQRTLDAVLGERRAEIFNSELVKVALAMKPAENRTSP